MYRIEAISAQVLKSPNKQDQIRRLSKVLLHPKAQLGGSISHMQFCFDLEGC